MNGAVSRRQAGRQERVMDGTQMADRIQPSDDIHATAVAVAFEIVALDDLAHADRRPKDHKEFALRVGEAARLILNAIRSE